MKGGPACRGELDAIRFHSTGLDPNTRQEISWQEVFSVRWTMFVLPIGYCLIHEGQSNASKLAAASSPAVLRAFGHCSASNVATALLRATSGAIYPDTV
jgi:hypothetical protein